MKNPELSFPVKNIHGGAKPGHFKNTAECATVTMPPPKTVLIPMQQHIGAPCTPTVGVGDTVYVGTKIGDCDKFVSSPIHSSVSGTVSKITTAYLTGGMEVPAIEIECDGNQTPDPSISPVKVETEEDLTKAVRDMGLVGLGGAGFPTHVKLTRQPDKPLDTLIINGAECEPYITTDYRECIESPEDVYDGIYTLLKILDFKKVVIAIEDNKPKAIEQLLKISSDKKDAENRVTVMKLKSRYPQGAEKVLIYTATGRVLPQGKLPADVGCVVMNITSVAAIAKYIKTGMPLVSKRLTIDGGAVNEPKNVSVPIGTKISEVLEFCGGLKSEPEKILVGGPMMGFAIPHTDFPIVKQNNAVLCLTKSEAKTEEPLACIRCGKCAMACPMNISPFRVAGAIKRENTDDAEKFGAFYCIECGSCAYACPSKRPLVQTMRIAKQKCRKK